MNREPLRLGTSTSVFFDCLKDDMKSWMFKKQEFTQSEYDLLNKACREFVELLAESEVQSLEYFLTCAMLPAAEKHPMTAAFMELKPKGMFWSVHAPFDGVDLASLDEDFRKWSVEQVIKAADIAAALGAKMMTVHPGLEVPDMGQRLQRLLLSGLSLAEISTHCYKIGVRPAIEILPRKCIGNSTDELLAILHYSDSPVAGICLDCNHLFPAKELPNQIRRLGARIITLHNSDHDDVDEKHWLPMEGVVDWQGYISTLREVGYTGPFMYEVKTVNNSAKDSIDAMQQNYRTLMK